MKITKDDIIKYIKGELPFGERHEFEKAILEDPFLMDAIEGLQQIESPEKFEEAVSELDSLIETTYGKRRVLIPTSGKSLAVAAVVSLLILSVAVVFLVPDYRQRIQSFLIKNDSRQERQQEQIEDLAMEKDAGPAGEESRSMITTTPPDSLEDTARAELNAQTDEYQEPVEVIRADSQIFLAEAQGAGAADTSVLPEQTGLPDSGIILADDQVNIDSADALTADATEINTELAMEPLAIEPEVEFTTEEIQTETAKRALAREAPATPAMQTKMVSGTVRSGGDNQPLTGVNVLVNGTSRGTITDNTGSYNLELKEDENLLTFSSIGFQSSQISIPDEGTYNISMASDLQQLSEVVVVGTGSRTLESDRYASPQSGRISYNRYLRENLIYPEEAAQNSITGRVIIEFTVTPDGDLTGFEVIRSLGYGCDEEALRLIREGPDWQPAFSNGIRTDERVRVAVWFRPPSD